MCKYLLIPYACFLYLQPAALNAAESNSFIIVTQNLNHFFDDKDDGNNEKILTSRQYQKRLQLLVSKIAGEYKQADLLAFQEVENIKVLKDISHRINSSHGINYLPVLVEGNDPSGIDVGYLIRDSWHIRSLSSLFKNTVYTKQGDSLFSRPPLVIELCSKKCFTVMNLHLRSMLGLRSNKSGIWVALKRQRQSESIARWIQQFQHDNPDKYLIIAGDFNALSPSDSYADSVGTIIGNPDQKRPRYKSPDLVSKDLTDITKRVKPRYRFSYKYRGRQQQLDYILVSSNLTENIKSISFSTIDYNFSDHAAVSATFSLH